MANEGKSIDEFTNNVMTKEEIEPIIKYHGRSSPS